jgi:hypothetical protein
MSRAKRAKWTSCKGNNFIGMSPSWLFADYNKRRIKKGLMHLICRDPSVRYPDDLLTNLCLQFLFLVP